MIRIVCPMSRRILLLITDLEIGGTPTVVRELAIRLNRPPEVVVEVTCLKGWGPVADQLRDAGVTVTALGATRVWQFPHVLRTLRERMEERSIDTVFSFLIHANYVAARATRRLSAVRWLQSIQTIQKRPKWHWWLQGHIGNAADRVVVPSTAVAQAARERCGINSERIVIIPNGIDPSAFPRVNVFARTDAIRVGFLGRFDAVKQLNHFVKSIWFAGKCDDRIQGHIFGSGPDDPAKYISTYGVQDRVFVRGPVPEPQEALREMDVLFSTSLEEGFGLVVLEAMASGVPVIARKAGGVTDIIQDRANGLLIFPTIQDDYQGLFDRLDLLIRGPDFRRKLIEGGLATAQRYAWNLVMNQYRELLNLPTSV
jgi:glycosyltransferase involved in cell wall biosynthesis